MSTERRPAAPEGRFFVPGATETMLGPICAHNVAAASLSALGATVFRAIVYFLRQFKQTAIRRNECCCMVRKSEDVVWLVREGLAAASEGSDALDIAP